MAIQQTVYSNHVEREARKLLGNRHQWKHVRNKETGVSFVAVPSGDRVYQVHPFGLGCNCEATQQWNAPLCKHRLAVQMANREDERAAMLEELAEAAPSLRDMRSLYPGCASGCGQITEGDLLCDDCSAQAERTARMAAARAQVLAAWTTE